MPGKILSSVLRNGIENLKRPGQQIRKIIRDLPKIPRIAGSALRNGGRRVRDAGESAGKSAKKWKRD